MIINDVNSVIRVNVQGLARKNMMSIKDVAEKIGISNSYMCNLMYDRPFTVEHLLALSGLFGVTIAYMLSQHEYITQDEEERVLGYEICEDGARALASGIVVQAVRDYIKALMEEDTAEISSLETFFKSEWCHDLTHRDYSRAFSKVPDKVKKYKKLSLQAKNDGVLTCNVDETSPHSFDCPICGGKVFTNIKKSSRRNRTGTVNVYWSARCAGCSTEHKLLIGEER